MDTIGKRLDAFLEQKGVSVTDFGDKIGVHPNSIYRLIKEGRGMNSTTMMKIVEMFPSINLHWLITGEGPQTKSNYEEVNQDVQKEDAPFYPKNEDRELKHKVQAILKNEVVLDAFVEILKRWNKN